jgi:hypothetical protein
MSNIGTTPIRSTDAPNEIGLMIRSAKERAIKRTNIPATNSASVVIPTINMTFECDIFAGLSKAITSRSKASGTKKIANNEAAMSRPIV